MTFPILSPLLHHSALHSSFDSVDIVCECVYAQFVEYWKENSIKKTRWQRHFMGTLDSRQVDSHWTSLYFSLIPILCRAVFKGLKNKMGLGNCIMMVGISIHTHTQILIQLFVCNGTLSLSLSGYWCCSTPKSSS